MRLIETLIPWSRNSAWYGWLHHDWAMGIAARRGKARACVALARKMAGLLYAMWRDGTEFGPLAVRRSVAAAAWQVMHVTSSLGRLNRQGGEHVITAGLFKRAVN